MKKMRRLTLFILIAALVACQNEAPKELPIAIIPLPQQISTPNGTYKIPANPRVYVQDEEAKRIIQLFLDASGTEADFIDDPQKSDWQILISDDATDTSNEEAYELDIYSNCCRPTNLPNTSRFCRFPIARHFLGEVCT